MLDFWGLPSETQSRLQEERRKVTGTAQRITDTSKETGMQVMKGDMRGNIGGMLKAQAQNVAMTECTEIGLQYCEDL